MSTTITTVSSSSLSRKFTHFQLRNHPFGRSCKQDLQSRSCFCKNPSFKLEYDTNFLGFSTKNLGFSLRRKLGSPANAEKGEEPKYVVDEAEEARGQSTMPSRFRYLAKEAPDRPVRWPWFIALAFLIYAWRTVLWELSNWKKVILGIIKFVGYLSKLALALIFHFIGDPVTSLIRFIETSIYTVRAFYSSIVAYAPIPELSTIIILSSLVFAIAEATVPDSMTTQRYSLTLSGIIGFLAVKGVISELFFYVLLLGLFGFSLFIKKRDYVSSALPVAAVLAAIGEPWVRIIVVGLYLSMAVLHYSKKLSEGKVEENEVSVTGNRVPLPLLGIALAIGIKVAAKWAGYRHLTWMIV